MTAEQNSVRFSWVAMALSFLASGVGHIYSGHVAKGLFLYLARFALPLLCIFAAFAQPSNAVLIGLILLPALATILVFLYSPIDAWVITKRTSSEYKLKDYNRSSLYWLLIVMQLAYPVALTCGIKKYVYQAFVMPARSMSPNILAGDRIIVNKRPFSDEFPERGDLIAFRTPPSEPGSTWLARVIGVAGDELKINDREIEVNGKKLERERVPSESVAKLRKHVEGNVYNETLAGSRYQVIFKEDAGETDSSDESSKEVTLTVPNRSVFVMGDNRDFSRDSRHIGSVHAADVIGSVEYIFLPAQTWSRFGVYQD